MSTSELGLRTWWIREPGKPAIYRIAIGGLITALGSDATAVAFGFYLYDRTGSALWLSIWFFLSFGITGVLTPVFGWLADRFDRRRLILFSDVAAAACSTALIAAHDPVVLVAIAFVASIVGRAGSPSFAAALPNLAGEERLEWANGTLGVAFNIGRLVGPLVRGGRPSGRRRAERRRGPVRRVRVRCRDLPRGGGKHMVAARSVPGGRRRRPNRCRGGRRDEERRASRVLDRVRRSEAPRAHLHLGRGVLRGRHRARGRAAARSRTRRGRARVRCARGGVGRRVDPRQPVGAEAPRGPGRPRHLDRRRRDRDRVGADRALAVVHPDHRAVGAGRGRERRRGRRGIFDDPAERVGRRPRSRVLGVPDIGADRERDRLRHRGHDRRLARATVGLRARRGGVGALCAAAPTAGASTSNPDRSRPASRLTTAVLILWDEGATTLVG